MDGKWKPFIIRELLTGKKRFNELQKGVDGISQKVLKSFMQSTFRERRQRFPGRKRKALIWETKRSSTRLETARADIYSRCFTLGTGKVHITVSRKLTSHFVIFLRSGPGKTRNRWTESSGRPDSCGRSGTEKQGSLPTAE